MRKLTVSGRNLVWEDREPFFYLWAIRRGRSFIA